MRTVFGVRPERAIAAGGWVGKWRWHGGVNQSLSLAGQLNKRIQLAKKAGVPIYFLCEGGLR